MGTKSPRRGGHRTCRLTGSAQSAQRTPKNRKTAALKGEARLIDPCNASAHQGPAHGAGLRRPTGESSHRSSRHHGAASTPLDPPPDTDPTTRLAAQQPRFTPKRRGVPNCVGGWPLGAVTGCGSARALPQVGLQSQTGACVHHRCSPRVDGRDDLLRRDALQVGAGRRQVGMAELSLDQGQRDPLVEQLDSVCVAELVRGQAAAHPGRDRRPVQLKPCRALTRRGRGSVRRSRRTAARRVASRVRSATAATPTTPTGPCQPRAGDRSFRA
jgi:hypothetical protein